MSDFEAAGSLFSFDEEADAYTAVVNGVEFLCDDVEEGYDEEARRMAELYPEKLPEILDFLIPQMQPIYGALDRAALPEQLGPPTIHLDTFKIQYLSQSLDEHILEFEYTGDFEEFSYFNIDG